MREALGRKRNSVPNLIEVAGETGKYLTVITVTGAARERLLEIKPDRSPNGDEPKLAVYLGEPEENDQLVEHRGEPLLWISTAVSAAIDGCLVDVVETSEGMGFVIGPLDAGNDARSLEEPS